MRRYRTETQELQEIPEGKPQARLWELCFVQGEYSAGSASEAIWFARFACKKAGRVFVKTSAVWRAK